MMGEQNHTLLQIFPPHVILRLSFSKALVKRLFLRFVEAVIRNGAHNSSDHSLTVFVAPLYHPDLLYSPESRSPKGGKERL